MIITRPMLAATVKDITKLTYPLLATPKIDGIRCLVIHGVPRTRTFKLIPNYYISAKLRTLNHSLDGELIVGDNFQQCSSGIMSHEGEPDFKYLVFDCCLYEDAPYEHRAAALLHLKLPDFCSVLAPQLINNEEELLEYEAKCLKGKHEGVMLRRPNSPYKCGRSTFKEGFLLKLKRFEDSEATVIGFEEAMHNANRQTKDAFGLSERSNHGHRMYRKNTLGALIVKDVKTNIEFNIGTGFTDADRNDIWDNQSDYLGKILTYKFQPHGVKDKPRCPVFKCWRLDL